MQYFQEMTPPGEWTKSCTGRLSPSLKRTPSWVDKILHKATLADAQTTNIEIGDHGGWDGIQPLVCSAQISLRATWGCARFCPSTVGFLCSVVFTSADVERAGSPSSTLRVRLVSLRRRSWRCEDGRKVKSLPQRHQLSSNDLVDELDSQLLAMAAAA